MSFFLWSHELQHARLLCPSLSLGVCSNSCPLSQWCHPTISSSVTHFSSCPQSFPASGSFPINWFFASSGQSFGDSALAPILPMNIQGWFPLGLTGWISLQSKGLKSLLQHQFESINSSVLSLLYGPTLTQDMAEEAATSRGRNWEGFCSQPRNLGDPQLGEGAAMPRPPVGRTQKPRSSEDCGAEEWLCRTSPW